MIFMAKKVKDERKIVKLRLKNNNEDYWGNEKLYKSTLEEQMDIKLDIENFLHEQKTLKDDLEEQLEKLKENLNEWNHNGNQKLLYLKWIEEIGYELAYLVEFMRDMDDKYFSLLWGLKAPREYWNSAKKITEIKSMDQEYKNSCINNLENLIKQINRDMDNRILINGLAQVIK